MFNIIHIEWWIYIFNSLNIAKDWIDLKMHINELHKIAYCISWIVSTNSCCVLFFSGICQEVWNWKIRMKKMENGKSNNENSLQIIIFRFFIKNENFIVFKKKQNGAIAGKIVSFFFYLSVFVTFTCKNKPEDNQVHSCKTWGWNVDATRFFIHEYLLNEL